MRLEHSFQLAMSLLWKVCVSCTDTILVVLYVDKWGFVLDSGVWKEGTDNVEV